MHCLRFPQRVAALLSSLKPIRTNNKALDIGCAVGGSSFELAKEFDHVDAFDFSESFIAAAIQMKGDEVGKNVKKIQFKIPVEAELFEAVEACHEDGVDDAVRSKVHFFTGDACNLSRMQADGKIDTYDGIIMGNLLCRLPDPMACLNDLSAIMNPGGVVVMVTPFSWLTEFTPRDKWLGGFYGDSFSSADSNKGVAIRSKDVLQKVMEKNGFEKIHEQQMPLIIREHQRKYQYIISEATAWRKAA